jgi:hypothetical protein
MFQCNPFLTIWSDAGNPQAGRAGTFTLDIAAGARFADSMPLLGKIAFLWEKWQYLLLVWFHACGDQGGKPHRAGTTWIRRT